ncbi:O-antigen ligase family protein [Streptomyces sp. NPDC051104]|uniref:O-antigen ligase family protein n=1 Tax=Streptomyces sp. NPDC051104 TaxID=3155044 RepID=UPI003431A092
MSAAATSNVVLRQQRRLFLSALSVFCILAGGTLYRLKWNAEFTVAVFLIAIFSLPCALFRRPDQSAGQLEPINPLRQRIPLPLWSFAACVILSEIRMQTVEGAQNTLVYLSFVAVMAIAASWTSAGSPLLLLTWVRSAAVVMAVCYIFTVIVTGPGSDSFYLNSDRGYGEIAWVGVVAAVSLAKPSRFGYILPLLLLAACVLSLSRTVMAVCALLFLSVVTQRRERGERRKLLLLTAAMAGGAYFLLTRYQPLEDRFTHNDGQQVAGWEVGTSGRATMWRVTWESIKKSPWTGHGIGSAEHLMSRLAMDHPHNDYLRLWHDFGIIGLGLWVASILVLGRGAYRRWRAASNDADRAIHKAALLALVGLSLNVITSNLLVYISVMVPVAVIIGTSMGRANAEGVRLAPSSARGCGAPNDEVRKDLTEACVGAAMSE